jgi:hypothetical protein
VNITKTLATLGGAVAITAASLALTAGPSFGADSGTITASVGVAGSGPCLTVRTPEVSFGADVVLPKEGSSSIVSYDGAAIANCGDIAAEILARASAFSDAKESTLWHLRPSGGECSLLRAALSVSGKPANPGDLSEFDRTLIDSLPGQESVTSLKLALELPCDGSGPASGTTMATTITFTALAAPSP